MSSPFPDPIVIPIADAGRMSTVLSRVSLEAGNADLNGNQQEQAITWQGRTVKKVLVGTAIAGGALFVFLFVIGSIVDSDPVKFTAVGCGIVGLLSFLSRYSCASEYNHPDMPIDV